MLVNGSLNLGVTRRQAGAPAKGGVSSPLAMPPRGVLPGSQALPCMQNLILPRTQPQLQQQPNRQQRMGVRAQGLARKILAQPGIEGDPLAFLDVSEIYWKALRNQKHDPNRKGPSVVRYAPGRLNDFVPQGGQQQQQQPAQPVATTSAPSTTDYDVIICGGTLGLFLATALQLAGWRVAIVEKRLVKGRNQEWNISWGELQILSDLGLLSIEQLRTAVVSEFNPIRVGFLGGKDVWTKDVLNLGVQPRVLLDALRERFVGAGGIIFENTAFKGATIYEDGLRLTLSPGGRDAPLAVGDTNRPNGLEASAAPPRPLAPRNMTCRLLLDCMGHYSDIVKQIRGRVKPDGMCLVVGSCAEGFAPEDNQSADLLYSLTHARQDVQLFWEAFPAEGGAARTTYMFAYSDAHPDRPSFESLLDTYFELLPEYQNVPLDQLKFKRVLFGGFPCYSNGPLAPAFDRVMQIGDASAGQSPLSFGGFGSMMRHLGRLSGAIGHALRDNKLTRTDLGWIQPYQPSLSASWLFQRSMSIAVGQVAYPAGYAHAPAHAKAEAAADAAAARSSSSGWDISDMPMVLSATVGPGAALESTMALVAGKSAGFASGAIAPDDYFHEEALDNDTPSARAPATVVPNSVRLASAKAAAAEKAGNAPRPDLFERDLRSAPRWTRLPYTHVNEILGTNFGVMGLLGSRVLKPFLQDTIQLVPLSLSMTGMLIANPLVISRVLFQVGPQTLASWFGHYFSLIAFTLGHAVLSPLRSVIPDYTFHRLLDALQYGSGSDYHYHPDEEVLQAIAPPANGKAPLPLPGSTQPVAASAAPAAAAKEPVGAGRSSTQ